MTAAPSGVLCSGNIVFDIVVRPVDRLVWGTSTWVESVEEHMGGNGANTAYTLARLGAAVRLNSFIGRDSYGEKLLHKLESAGVDISFITRSQAATSTTVVLVNSGGHRLFLHRPGINAEAFSEPLEFTPELCAGMSHYHLANIFAFPHLRRHAPEMLRRARAAGLVTSLDMGWDSRNRWMEDFAPALPHVDVLFVNEDEARMLTGSAGFRASAQVLKQHGGQTLVLKLGGRGCAVFPIEGGEIIVPAFEVQAVDTTGAGDCFAGAYLSALLRGRDHAEAARFANAVAGLAIQRIGSTDGVLTLGETEAWMAAAPVREAFGEAEPHPINSPGN